jgi:hypothetical protein
MEAATSHNLVRLLAHGCKALHYTGHGFQQCLAFEDGKGMMHPLSAVQLKELFTAGGNALGVQFVFVSACYSETAGLLSATAPSAFILSPLFSMFECLE